MEYTESEKKYMEEEFVREPWFKKALVKPFNKLIFALALTGAVTGSISLIISSVSVHKTDGLNYYLDSNYEAIWGKGTIWYNSERDFLYFGKKIDKNDTKWDGTYPKGYFN